MIDEAGILKGSKRLWLFQKAQSVMANKYQAVQQDWKVPPDFGAL
jgi:hypothetical protein